MANQRQHEQPVWRDLCDAVRGKDLETWSRDMQPGDGKPFTVKSADHREIVVSSPTIKKVYPIPRADFDKIAPRWRAYRNGDIVDVSEFRLQIRSSSYLFGMLKWLDDRDAL